VRLRDQHHAPYVADPVTVAMQAASIAKGKQTPRQPCGRAGGKDGLPDAPQD